jgi:aminocarboxymuconate-semialdehyde decarboxylase
MKLDIFNHVAPEAFLQMVERERPEWAGPLRRLRLLWDIEGRLQLLEQWPDLQQVLTLTVPSIEYLAPAEKQVELACTANDGMAEICRRWPEKFPYFIASLPMSSVPAAIEEMDRSIEQLGARGIQLQTSVNGRPLDHPDFFPVFERITNHYGMAVWLHPYRPPSVPDYPSEDHSRYEVWQVLGWVYETSAAISRLVLSGLLDRLPSLRVITHHCGGMLPYFAGRADSLWGLIGTRSPDPEYQAAQAIVDKQPMSSWLRRFYGDTVLGGARAPLRCGLDFFGADHVVMASDCPYGPESGGFFIREAIASIEEMGLSEEDKEKLYYANAIELLTPTPRVTT